MENNRTEPIYSSRIIKVYIEYIRQFHPDTDIQSLLSGSRISSFEVEDPAHWFTQDQVDSFYTAAVAATGNNQIAREAGRFTVLSKGFGPLRHYTVSLLGPGALFMLMEKMYKTMSRGAKIQTRKLASDKVEITVAPRAGIREQPYQCENRMGTFESLPKLFTGTMGRIEHPECRYRGDKICCYRITWDHNRSYTLKKFRNWFLLTSLPVWAFMLGKLPLEIWTAAGTVFAIIISALTFLSDTLEKTELRKTIQTQGNTAKAHLEEMQIRYNNALLVQQIGQNAASIRDINSFIPEISRLMERHLDFDRGIILLANKDATRLVFSAGYGYSPTEKSVMKNTFFHLDKPDSKGFFVVAFKTQKPQLIDDIADISYKLSRRSRQIAEALGVQSLICVPIIYEDRSLGIIAVDNKITKRRLNQSDVNLLMAIASQTAAGIINAMSFEKIRESEEKYRAILESIEEGYFELDAQGKVTFFNEALPSISGFSEKAIIGTDCRSLLYGNSLLAFDRALDSVRATGRPQSVSEIKFSHKNGATLLLDISISPKKEDGKLEPGFRVVVRDVTEKIAAEKKQKNLELQLLQSQKMEAIGTLAGGLAHDFNNILMGILGNASLMLIDMQPDNPCYDRLKNIENYVENGASLTHQLLGFARGAKYEVRSTDLNALIKKNAEMFGRTKKEIHIKYDFKEGLWPTEVDRGQIEQVLLNLYVNAWQAMPAGGNILIKTDNTFLTTEDGKKHELPPGKYIRIAVIDSGVGMSEEVRRRIFEPFFTTKPKGRGTGLGLASAYGIIKNHSGSIDVKSRPGQGSTFSIYLPASEKRSAENQADLMEIKKGKGTILLVDDEKMILEVGKEYLHTLGYKAEIAGSGIEALTLFENDPGRFDLIILDMIMPEMNGKDTFKTIRALRKDQPVLFSSGYSLDEKSRSVIQSSDCGFIQKPFNIQRLGKAIGEILQTGP